MPDLPTRHVVEILLPLFSNAGKRFGREPFDRTRDELLDCFGGITAFTRSPAEGLTATSQPPRAHREVRTDSRFH